jgi:hypothetical protein
MPKLLLFAACEKAMVDQNNVASLMSLLEEINVQVPPGVVPPANAMAPMAWTIFSLWERTPADQGKIFEQRSALMTAAGAIRVETPVAVIELKTDRHRVIGTIMGMPVANPGPHFVKAFIREKGGANWTEAGSYPLTIKWVSTTTPTVH